MGHWLISSVSLSCPILGEKWNFLKSVSPAKDPKDFITAVRGLHDRTEDRWEVWELVRSGKGRGHLSLMMKPSSGLQIIDEVHEAERKVRNSSIILASRALHSGREQDIFFSHWAL